MLLDQLLRNPNAGQTLGLLGSYLMAAGAPTTDPGGSMKTMAQGLQQTAQMAQQSRLAQENSAIRKQQLDMQKQALDETAAKRQTDLEANQRRLGLLYGPAGDKPWTDPDTGVTQQQTGLLSKLPPDKRDLVAGMEAAQPGSGLRMYYEQQSKTAEPETFGQPVEATGADGKPVLIRTGNRGTVQPVDGYGPKPLPPKDTPAIINARALGLKEGTPAFDAYVRAATDRSQSTFAPVEIYDPNSPTGTRLVDRASALGQPGKPTTGVEITYDENNRPVVRTGVRPGVEKSTKGASEKDIGDLSEQIAGIRSIRQSFKPEYLTYQGQAGQLWNSLKAKAGSDLTTQQRQDLEGFRTLRADAGQVAAKTIKEMSGAAVTASELPRQEVYLPVVGTGIFDGDDPVTFESKMNRLESLSLSAAWRKRTLIDTGMSLEQAAAKAPLYAENPSTGRKLWLHEYVDQMQAANPGASVSDIIAQWSDKYKRANP